MRRSTTRTRLLQAAGVGVAAALAAATFSAPVTAAPNNNNSEKLRTAVTPAGISEHLRALQAAADANGGNRFAGSSGYDASAQYVFDTLKAAGYSPTFQEFTYSAFFTVRPTTFSQSTPVQRTFDASQFTIMSYSGSGTVTDTVAEPAGVAAPIPPNNVLSPVNQGCAPENFTADNAGQIALISRGSCSFRIKATNALAAGATGVVVYNNIPGLLNGTLSEADGLAAGPVIGLTQALGQELVSQLAGGPVTVTLDAETEAGELPTRNVFAELPGKDKGENIVMAGGHLDSVNAGPGINDNGSGSAALLEIAEQMAKTKPFNTVRFAWWSAEESGLVGAREYVTALSQAERDKIALYLNFDMVGSPNYARFIYDGDNDSFATGPGNPSAVAPEGSAAIERNFAAYFEGQGLASEPTPFSGRSDYGPFIEVGIPSGGLFTGAEGIKTAAQAAKFGGTAGIAYDPCYHQACDTFANVNQKGLDEMSDAMAHSIITFAQNTSAVNGEKGKGNFKGDPVGSNSGGGTTGGGGLHDDHDHELDTE